MQINLFLANFPIFYQLKTQKKQKFSGVFRGYDMGTLPRKRVKNLPKNVHYNSLKSVSPDILNRLITAHPNINYLRNEFNY